MRNIELVALLLVVWTPIFPIFVCMVPPVILVSVLCDMRKQRRGITLERTAVVSRIAIFLICVVDGYLFI